MRYNDKINLITMLHEKMISRKINKYLEKHDYHTKIEIKLFLIAVTQIILFEDQYKIYSIQSNRIDYRIHILTI